MRSFCIAKASLIFSTKIISVIGYKVIKLLTKFLGVFRKGKTPITARLHIEHVVICSPSREGKPVLYPRYKHGNKVFTNNFFKLLVMIV